MSTTILVPLDGSWRSEAALVPAVPLAHRMGAELVLLSTQWAASELPTTRHYLEGKRAPIGGDCEIRPVLERDAAAAIVSAASAPGTLVCMATHGHGGVIRGVLGSVSEAVVRSSAAPVVLVGPCLDPAWKLPEHPALLLALDGSDTARAAIPAGVDLARALGADLRLLQVPRPSDVVNVAEFGGVDVDTLEAEVDELGRLGLHAEYEVIDGFDPAEVLVHDAVAHRASFVVMATHGSTGLARVALGSVVQRVVRRASCPVLVVRPAELFDERNHEEAERCVPT